MSNFGIREKNIESYLGDCDGDCDEHDTAEDEEHVLIDELMQERERQRQQQTRHPVDENRNGHGGRSSILREHFGRVHERNGSQTQRKAAQENQNASNATVRKEPIQILNKHLFSLLFSLKR
jgi:hypothetical protein